MGQGSVRRFAAKFETVGAIPTSKSLFGDFEKRPFPSTEPPVYEIRDPGVISFFGRDNRDLANLSQVLARSCDVRPWRVVSLVCK